MDRIETASAHVVLVKPDLVVCRYKPGAKVTGATARENLLARMALPGSTPHVVLTVFPAGAEFEMSLFDRNQYQEPAVGTRTRALVFVADNAAMETMINLYFAYHPTRVTKRVFTTEEAALAWMEQELLGQA